MQSALRLQEPQRLLQDPITLLGREAKQRQAADDEVERVRPELRVELERVCGDDMATRKAPLEELHEVRIALDEIKVARRHAACEQRRRDSTRAGTELDDARRYADVLRHQPGQPLAARSESADRERIANPPLQKMAEIVVGRMRMLRLGHAIAFLAKKRLEQSMQTEASWRGSARCGTSRDPRHTAARMDLLPVCRH